jgi:hypothetical protein
MIQSDFSDPIPFLGGTCQGLEKYYRGQQNPVLWWSGR